MRIEDIQVGKTYEGPRDERKGILGTRRVISIHAEPLMNGERLLTFAVEPGPNPPASWISHSSMDVAKFAAWAEREVPCPPRPEPDHKAVDDLPSPLLVMSDRGFYVRLKLKNDGLGFVDLDDEMTLPGAVLAAHKLGHDCKFWSDNRESSFYRPHRIPDGVRPRCADPQDDAPGFGMR